MRSVVDRNVVMRRIPICHCRHNDVFDTSPPLPWTIVMNLLSPYTLLMVNGRAQIRWHVEVKVCERTPVCASADNLHTAAVCMAPAVGATITHVNRKWWCKTLWLVHSQHLWPVAYRRWGGVGVFKPPPETSKSLQNRAKLNPICENC